MPAMGAFRHLSGRLDSAGRAACRVAGIVPLHRLPVVGTTAATAQRPARFCRYVVPLLPLMLSRSGPSLNTTKSTDDD